MSGVVVDGDAVVFTAALDQLTESIDALVGEASAEIAACASIEPSGPMPPTPPTPRRGMLVLHGSRIGRVVGRRWADLLVDLGGRVETVPPEECRWVERGYVPRVGDRVMLGDRSGTVIADEVVIEWPNGQRSRVARETVWPLEVGGWLAKLEPSVDGEEMPF